MAVPAAVPVQAAAGLPLPPSVETAPRGRGGHQPGRARSGLPERVLPGRHHLQREEPGPLGDAGLDARVLLSASPRACWPRPERNNISPSLLLAVMVNESDLEREGRQRHRRTAQLYAKDSGLMGIRCVVDKHGKCTNGYVRGLAWKTVMDPLTNIELGARELARGAPAASTRKTVRVRNGGQRRGEAEVRAVPAQDPRLLGPLQPRPRLHSTGSARHYPHRVAVLRHALAQALNVEAARAEAGPAPHHPRSGPARAHRRSARRAAIPQAVQPDPRGRRPVLQRGRPAPRPPVN